MEVRHFGWTQKNWNKEYGEWGISHRASVSLEDFLPSTPAPSCFALLPPVKLNPCYLQRGNFHIHLYI